MPKVPKRKRQGKEINGRRGDEPENGQEYEDGDDDSVDSQSQEQLPSSQQQQQLPVAVAAALGQPMSTVGQRSSARQKQVRAAVAAVTTSSRGSSGEGRGESRGHSTQSQQSTQSNIEKVASDNKVWVQCNRCDKWRSLPMTVDPRTLPEVWTCELNMYDPARMSCDVPEEEYSKEEEQQELPLKSFLKIWVKRLKSADRAESRLSTAAVTRNKKRKLDAEWIQCSNPSCGKWRAISKGIESANLIKRLNKNKRFGGDTNWFCSMNSWDDTTASCAAPQEPLWNCRWNLIRAMNNAPEKTGSV